MSREKCLEFPKKGKTLMYQTKPKKFRKNASRLRNQSPKCVEKCHCPPRHSRVVSEARKSGQGKQTEGKRGKKVGTDCLGVVPFPFSSTHGDGLAASLSNGLGQCGIRAAPAFHKLLDVPPRAVHDAKARDVDGTVLGHLAFPAVVHYLDNCGHLCESNFMTIDTDFT